MTEEVQPKSLLARCLDYFGRFPGQTVTQFRDECARLTANDRKELVSLFNEMGLPTRVERQS